MGHVGRSPAELAREFEPSGQTILTGVVASVRQEALCT